jgi:colicin import membrane protein
MSTIPKPRRTSPENDPFFYGWRYVRRAGNNGRKVWVEVPLTREDVLHPQEGDHVMNGSPHDEDCIYLTNVCKARTADQPNAVVLHDVGVYWDVPGLEHHSPDVTVIFGVRRVQPWPSFHVAVEGVRPTVLFEVTSLCTRDGDLLDKKREYHRAGVPYYIIVDDQARRGQPRRLRLLGYRRGPRGYRRMPLSADGRLWLEPLGMWLAIEGARVVCYDAAGERLLEYAELEKARVAAEQQARTEAEARVAAEAKMRDLEAELKRLRGEL